MNRFVRKHGVRVAGFSAGCTQAWQAGLWPGNVRELQNVVERGVIMCGDSEELQAAHLGLAQIPAPAVQAVSPAIPGGMDQEPHPAPHTSSSPLAELSPAALEKRHIFHLLDSCQGNRTPAARKLGISISTLRHKPNEYVVASRDDQAAESDHL